MNHDLTKFEAQGFLVDGCHDEAISTGLTLYQGLVRWAAFLNDGLEVQRGSSLQFGPLALWTGYAKYDAVTVQRVS